MWRRVVSLAICLSLAPCLLSSEPVQSSQSVTLSRADYETIVTALTQARGQVVESSEAIKELSSQLEKSSEEMRRQSRRLTMLSIFCAGLGAALVLDSVALVVNSFK